MNNLIAPIGAVILIIGAILLVGMPAARRMAPWMGSYVGVRNDADLIATRAAWHRMGLFSGGVLLVLAVALFVSDLDLYLAPVGYAVAIIAGSAANVGGGVKRRAELVHTDRERITSTGLLRASLAMTVGIIIAANLASFKLSNEANHWSGLLSLRSALWPFSLDMRQILVIGLVSVFVSALACACQWVQTRRQSIAGVSARVDSMIRALTSKRIALAALGAQIMLVGSIFPGLQIFTLNVIGYDYTVNAQADVVGSLLGLAVFTAGMAVCLRAVLFPLWIRPRNIFRTTALGNTQSDSDTINLRTPADAHAEETDVWNSK
ncbi:hypothetical protein [Glutamicibacter sp. NPDC087344]|uniref:hypothetical protein n=1 Tax=Glutamicibacter sp. NPDC087344 TaxID=3363994 RepID=UPI0038214D58